jgi:hypothetical protein
MRGLLVANNFDIRMEDGSNSSGEGNDYPLEEMYEDNHAVELVDPLVYHGWCCNNPPTPFALPEALSMNQRRWNSGEKEVLDQFVKELSQRLKTGMGKREMWKKRGGEDDSWRCYTWMWEDLLCRQFHKTEVVKKTAATTEVQLLCWQRLAEVLGRNVISETFSRDRQRMDVAICPTGYAVENW